MIRPAAVTPMTMSGFCAFPSEGSHEYCQIREFPCTCPCHTEGEKRWTR